MAGLRAACAAFLAVALVATGCMSDDDSEAKATMTGQSGATWQEPPLPEAGKETIRVDRFNSYLDGAGASQARSPLSAATAFLGVAGSRVGRARLTMDAPAEARDEATVTVTLGGLLDDSVREVRYVLELRREEDGTWRLASATRVQRCAPGRGHQSFSAEPCL
jgi:hypothetical protein